MVEEKIYTIPLKEAYKKNDTRKAPYAMRMIKDFVKTHAKVNEVKIGSNLNHSIWSRGATKPPQKIRIKAVKDGDVAKVELMGFEYLEFIAKPRAESKGMKEKLMERLGPKAIEKEEQSKIAEGKTEETKTENNSDNKTEVKEDKKETKTVEKHEHAKPEQHVNKKQANVQRIQKQDSQKKK